MAHTVAFRGACTPLSFDLVSILYRKSQGLEAYERYLRDAGQNQQARDIIQKLYQQDSEAVRQLRTITSQCLGGNA